MIVSNISAIVEEALNRELADLVSKDEILTEEEAERMDDIMKVLAKMQSPLTELIEDKED